MSELRVQCNALKIVNKGGGTKSGSKWEEKTIELDKNTAPPGVMMDGESKIKMIIREKVRTETKCTGTDYIIFNCPICDKRNKRHVFDAQKEDKGSILVFRCNGCYRMVEVSRPMDMIKTLVHPPVGLVGPNGKPLQS